VQELRASIDTVIEYVNGFEASGSFDVPAFNWLSLGYRRPRADVMAQLVAVIQQL